MAKKRKRPRGSEPRTKRRSVNVTPALDRSIERHALAQGLSWGNTANQMLTEQMETVTGRNETERRARELLAWFEAIPKAVQPTVWDLGLAAAGIKNEKPTTRKRRGANAKASRRQQHKHGGQRNE